MDTLLFALDAILPIVLLILLGYFLKRIRLFTKEFLSVGNKVCFRVFLPAFLFYNIYTIESLKDVNWVFIAYGAGRGARPVFHRAPVRVALRQGQCEKGRAAASGVPLEFRHHRRAPCHVAVRGGGRGGGQPAFGVRHHGIQCFRRRFAFRVPRGRGKTVCKKSLARHRENPLIIGIACAVCVLGVREIFVAADVSFRLSDIGFVASALEYVAKMATPFGLIMLGGEFEFSAVGRLWKEIAFGTFMRVVFAPALFLTVAYFCIPGLSGAHYASYIALFGTPVAVSSAIMAKEMEGDAELAGQLVVWTTVLSAFTLFAAILIFKSIGAL